MLLCCLPFSVWAQKQDFQLWSKLELSYKPHKKITIGLNEGFRLRENASLPTKSFTNLSINYRHNKQFRLAGGYRFIQAFDSRLHSLPYERREGAWAPQFEGRAFSLAGLARAHTAGLSRGAIEPSPRAKDRVITLDIPGSEISAQHADDDARTDYESVEHLPRG